MLLLFNGQLQSTTRAASNDVPGVENVVARQLLGSSHHLFSADDTNVVGGLQVFRSRVWVSDQKEKQGEKKFSLEFYL